MTKHFLSRLSRRMESTKFGKVVWRIFSVSATVVTLCLAIILSMALYNIIDDKIVRSKPMDDLYLIEYYGSYVSPYVIYCDYYQKGFLYNAVTGEKTLTNINWICKSSDGDSLAFFSADKKRGYFNRFTGELVIPAQYEKAWVFSEGVAWVKKDGVLSLIDHDGNPVLDRTFPYTERIDDYCFHNGLCAMLGDNECIGIINMQGEWVVEPNYQYIQRERGFWRVETYDDLYGLFDKNGYVFLPAEYDRINVDAEYVYVHTSEHYDQIIDFEGNIICCNDFYEVVKMYYTTDESDENGCWKKAPTNIWKYRTSDGYYGLIDRNGNVITPPSYYDIDAIDVDKYVCSSIKGTVILNDKGKEIGEK